MTKSDVESGSVVGATFLVAGTCIGAGMLGLPILTSFGGFLPAMVFYVISAIFMACTGLLYLEVCLWMHEESNLVSMAGKFLGKWGRGLTWVVYLYLFYSLTVAYISGSGTMITDLVDGAMPSWLAMVIFTAVFGTMVYFGVAAVDKTNLVLVTGLGIAYVAFLVLGTPHVEKGLLAHMNWGASMLALPVILSSFGYQGTIPSLVTYLVRNPQRVRTAIIWGVVLTFIVYGVWEVLILGIVPSQGGLQEAFFTGGHPLTPLKTILANPWVFVAGEFFAFFALASSFLGVTIGLRDFLADGLKVEKSELGRLFLCLLIFVPAVIVSLVNPRLFLLALQYGGGLGGALILGVLPTVLVWVGRYVKKLHSPYQLGGGRVTLTVLSVVILVVLAVQFVGVQRLLSWSGISQ